MKKGIGWKIKMARTESGLTQQTLGDKLKTSHSVIATWENEKFMPNQESLKKLAEALNKPISYFFESEYDPKNNIKQLNLVKDSSANEYDANTLQLPLLSFNAENLPYFTNDDVTGFIQVPRFLFPGTKFVFQNTSKAMEPQICAGDYCIIKPENIFIDGKITMIKIGSDFHIYKISKGKTIELSALNPEASVPQLKEYKIVGIVTGVIKKVD